MDEGVKALVEFFNERGLTTHMSCEGHYPEKPSMSMFWISFDKSVSIDDLLSIKMDLEKFKRLEECSNN